MRVLAKKIIVECAVLRCSRREETLRRLTEESLAERDHAGEINLSIRESGRRIKFRRGQVAAFVQVVQADQQRIPRESRKTLVGRIPVSSRIYRQHLPDRLAGGL